jgi:hypothetical protein
LTEFDDVPNDFQGPMMIMMHRWIYSKMADFPSRFGFLGIGMISERRKLMRKQLNTAEIGGFPVSEMVRGGVTWLPPAHLAIDSFQLVGLGQVIAETRPVWVWIKAYPGFQI